MWEFNTPMLIKSILYFCIVFWIYIIYKTLKYRKSKYLWEKYLSYSIFELLAIFFLHLFLISGLFYVFNSATSIQEFISSGIPLFLKIVLFMILPTYIMYICYGFWKNILSYLDGFSQQNETFKNILSFIFGFCSFVFILTIVWILWFYNFFSLGIIVLIFSYFWRKQCQELLSTMSTKKIETRQTNHFSSYVLSSDFFFYIITFVLSINFVSIFRPFPIGWDDLWAYMNFPQLFADAWEIIMIGSMHAWQVFTGIWYMFQSPTQAFFLNSVGIIISAIFLWSIFQKYLSSKNSTQLVNIPLILTAIFVSMPMMIFQQAKDIKHDAGLFFLSIGVFYIVFELLKKSDLHEYKNKFLGFLAKKENLISTKSLIFLIVGFVIWFTFTLKFTSLLFILWIIGTLFFVRFSYLWLFWFIALFVAIFTKLNLWKYMNIVYSQDNHVAINIFSWVCFIAWIVFIGLSFYKNKLSVTPFIKKIVAILVWIIIAMLPWGLYNLSSSGSISISAVLSWSPEKVEVNFLDIYSQDELDLREQKLKDFTLSNSGTTGNEDWWRYLWYEQWINNFVFMPLNLSMQVNQRWEFTDITYLYFALIPLIFLFLPLRRKSYIYLIGAIFIFEFLLFIFPYFPIIIGSIFPNTQIDSTIFSLFSNVFKAIFAQIVFPFGYLVLFIWFLIPFFILIKSIQDDEKNNIFKYNLVFALIYVFLWTISAYWVVWYGIVMYFNLLLAIGFGMYYACSITDWDNKENIIQKNIATIAILWVILVYFVFSTIPNGLLNLKKAGYTEYKSWVLNSLESPFLYNPDYITILFETNIHPDKHEDFIDNILDTKVSNYISALNKRNQQAENTIPKIDIYNVAQLEQVLREMKRAQSLVQIHPEVSKSLTNLYKWILHPNETFKNDKNIYRIGTFLRYYISDNHNRIYDDWLIMNFYTYILWWNPDESVKNMKDLWLEYFLVDLNAATIDKDERRNLTMRYESLLRTFTSSNLELISTDSKCLITARDMYMKSNKTHQDYMQYLAMAGVNYDSYENGEKISRINKRVYCYNTILNLIEEGKIDGNNYSYLLPIQQHLLEYYKISEDSDKIYEYMQTVIPHGYKAFFKIK